MTHLVNEGDNTRTIMVRVRVTLSEKQRLLEKTKEVGLTLSDLLRTSAIGGKPMRRKPSPDREALLKLHAEMGKEGSLLNQLCRALWRRQENSEYEVPIQAINHVLGKIEQLSDQLRTILTNHANDKG